MRGRLGAGKASSTTTSGQQTLTVTDDNSYWDSGQCPSSGLQSSSSDTPRDGTENGLPQSSADNQTPTDDSDDWAPPPSDSDAFSEPQSNGDFFDTTNQGNSYENSVSGRGCIHCKGPHPPSECPSRPKSGNCFCCRESGHMVNECPSRNGQRQRPDSRQCHKCGRTGHIAEYCSQSASERSSGNCANCGGRGHSAMQCPSPALTAGRGDGFHYENGSSGEAQGGFQSARAGNQAPVDAVCRSCQETGHFFHNCPKRVGAKDEAPSTGPYCPVIETTEEEAVNRNKTGINFDQYDKIDVTVSNSRGQETKEYETKKLDRFQDGNLDARLIEMIERLGFEKPTPVQRYSLPILADGKDLMACAQTGSGKTAAFVLPMVNMLIRQNCSFERNTRPQKPFALVLTPTRELTVQITKDAQAYCVRTDIAVKECYGGTGRMTQAKNIARGCHLLVGTTGRVLDFLNDGIICLSRLRYLVLDEADRMLDFGFQNAVDEIMQHPSRNRNSTIQTLMFSATFSTSVQDLARKYLREDFVKLDVGVVGAVNSDVSQSVLEVPKAEKKLRLLDLIREEIDRDAKTRILVFVETKRDCDFIAMFLSSSKIKATSIHGDRLQDQREKALKDFQEGDCPVLVATSVAARGLDISGVSHVINYDLPTEIDEYVHRVGRTGRVGNKGRATSFFDSFRDNAIRDDLRRSILDGGSEPPDFL
ncbi:probable ATP-dependent RNA helicase vasa-like [Galendromus occidentalis]|uniref:RNA helicase n=1 Tax=Galendromus occidentalis TaxID=34638 RepID=A0AAJ7L2V3_9ACAR|nr:probable ATP-dependent RNA helicase vasa-like [Galendromus occidentalis]